MNPSGPYPLDSLLDLEVPVRVRLGKTRMALADACELRANQLVELDRSSTGVVEIFVHEKCIARGRLVVVDGRYAIEIIELVPKGGSPASDPQND